MDGPTTSAVCKPRRPCRFYGSDNSVTCSPDGCNTFVSGLCNEHIATYFGLFMLLPHLKSTRGDYSNTYQYFNSYKKFEEGEVIIPTVAYFEKCATSLPDYTPSARIPLSPADGTPSLIRLNQNLLTCLKKGRSNFWMGGSFANAYRSITGDQVEYVQQDKGYRSIENVPAKLTIFNAQEKRYEVVNLEQVTTRGLRNLTKRFLPPSMSFNGVETVKAFAEANTIWVKSVGIVATKTIRYNSPLILYGLQPQVTTDNFDMLRSASIGPAPLNKSAWVLKCDEDSDPKRGSYSYLQNATGI